MKVFTLAVSFLAAVGAAAPTTPAAEPAKRGIADASLFGNFLSFGSSNIDFNYFLSVNSLDLSIFQTLNSVNGLNLDIFQALFQENAVLNLQNMLLFNQMFQLAQLASIGVLNGLDLSSFQLQALELALLQSNLGVQSLSSFIPSSLTPQIQSIAGSVGGGKSNNGENKNGTKL